MNLFYARVELHGGTDYVALHKEMEALEWSRTDLFQDRSVELPSGMYVVKAGASWSVSRLRDEIGDRLKKTNLSPDRQATVLVIESTGDVAIAAAVGWKAAA